jgi:O-acetyl-ADP-ribose deacetylase (regulator of RNase III)
MKKLSNGKIIRLVTGDITTVAADVIVNAANSALRGGGGVDGAIHRAGGPSIMQELDAIRARSGGCPTGGAVPTTAGKLPARWILHAVGPVHRDGKHGEPELLASCYKTCLTLADELGATTISFPSISTGAYGYSIEEAAPIALKTVAEYLENERSAITLATFVLFSSEDYSVYKSALAGLSGEQLE